MREPAPDTALFPAIATPSGSSIVLLAESVNSSDVSPKDFADLGMVKPQNFISAADLVVIDYGGFQMLVLPGQPVRLQVQALAGRSLADAKPYATRFFEYAKGPRVLGFNFNANFQFRNEAIHQVESYLKSEMLGQLAGANPTAAGFKIRFMYQTWRALLTIDPGASPNELQWQMNFERNAVTEDQVSEALNSIDQLSAANAEFIGRLPWNR